MSSMTTAIAISRNGMEHFEQGEKLYVLTAVLNLHKLLSLDRD